jgi:hypothetical protein
VQQSFENVVRQPTEDGMSLQKGANARLVLQARGHGVLRYRFASVATLVSRLFDHIVHKKGLEMPALAVPKVTDGGRMAAVLALFGNRKGSDPSPPRL